MSNDKTVLSAIVKFIPDNEQPRSTPSSDSPNIKTAISASDQRPQTFSFSESTESLSKSLSNKRIQSKPPYNCKMHKYGRCKCQIASTESDSLTPVSSLDLSRVHKPDSANSGSSIDSAMSVENIRKLIRDLVDEDVDRDVIERDNKNSLTKFIFRKPKKNNKNSLSMENITNSKSSIKTRAQTDPNLSQVLNTPLTDAKSNQSFDSIKLSEEFSTVDSRSARKLDYCSGKYFDPKIHGKDEEEFYQTRFKSIIRRCLPDHYTIANVPRTPSRVQRFNGSQKFRLSCSQNNCGHCYYLKFYILISLLVAILIYLIDPCFRISFGKTAVQSGTTLEPVVDIDNPKHNNTLLTPSNRTNRKLSQDFDPHPNHKSRKKQNSKHKLVSQETITTTNNDTISEPRTNPTLTTDELIGDTAEYCQFKLTYVILLLIGILVYWSVMFIYCCDIVLYFYYFQWHLLEAILFFLYSVVLFLFTIVAFFVGQHNIATTIVLISCLFGCILAWVAYRYHNEGVIPSIITSNDPDGNLLTQILSRKLFRKRTFSR